MLAIFPQLLFLTPLAIALLRVVAGIFVFLIAWQTATRRTEMSVVHLPIIGCAPAWLIWVAACGFAVVGGLLIIGAWTQVAALLAALGSLKLAILSRIYPPYATLSTSTYILLFVISLALTVTGAGIFAFDLPL